MIKLKGLGISPGIVAGHAMLFTAMPVSYTKECRDSTEEEIIRLRKAIEISLAELKKLYSKTKIKMAPKEAAIFEAQMMMLQDEDFVTKIEDEIITNRINGEWAVANVRDYYISVFESMDNEYLRERALDIKDIARRLIRHIQHNEEKRHNPIRRKSIIIAKELTPSDTACLNAEEILGLLTEAGGGTSHSTILARSMGIPSIAAIPQLMENIQWSDYIAFDGETGEIYINPTEEILRLMNRRKQYEEQSRRSNALNGKRSMTRDGHFIAIEANVASLNDVKAAIENDAEGIGLFRTEFMYLGRYQCPSEQEQFETYQAAALKMGDRPLTIRTLDIGGDKLVNYLDLHKENNSCIGYRAIRLCLDRRELFKTQLRAILRASAFGSVQVMFPMISTLKELREAKNLMEEAKKDLDFHGVPYKKDIPVGMMIETPAAALMSDVFARESDFFSIGTNDLAQLTLAVDRLNTSVQHLYNFFQPSLLRLIQKVVDNAHQNNIKVGMCGEAARERALIPVWAGMGLDGLSMNANTIRKAREAIEELSFDEVQKWIPELLSLSTDNDVKQFLSANINRFF